MKFIGPFLRLIRVQNLLIIALTQYMMRHLIVEPIARLIGKGAGLEVVLQLSQLDFFLLSLSTVMIAAAGNIINDYFDLRIDRINKPQKIVVGRYIKRRVAMGAHLVINGLGIVIGGYVAWRAGNIQLVGIHVISAILLWYYATAFKRQLLIGNLTIALLAAVIPLVVGVFEIPLLNRAYGPELLQAGQQSLSPAMYWLLAFAGFAFAITLAREITKDIADVAGDEKHGCRSVPIVYGRKTSVAIVTVIYVLIVVAAFYMQQVYLNDKYTLFYTIFGIALPVIVTAVSTLRATTPAQFNRAATLNKIATLAGICTSVVVYFFLTYKFDLL